ncbi:PilZ domain-containing protein [Hahella sp. HN01]|uniref:PilZ domain-containing protein n=1 Tax=Hahella sp. HN01 TaxID=2847262 RepID=UPI0035300961
MNMFVTGDTAMRQFIRHPTDIPILLEKKRPSKEGSYSESGVCTDTIIHKSPATVGVGCCPAASSHCMQNISCGGVCCMSPTSYEVGEKVMVVIAFVRPTFRTPAQVIWCNDVGNGFEIGLRFMSEKDAFAARMVEQVCHIEHYKREVLATEGRRMSGEEAAIEWIEKHAPDFPEFDSGSEVTTH